MQSLEAILKLTHWVEGPGQSDLGPDFEDQQNFKGEEEVRFDFELKFLQKQIFTAVFDYGRNKMLVNLTKLILRLELSINGR